MSGGTPNFRGVTPNFRGVTPKIRGDTPKIRGIPLKLGVPNNDSIVKVFKVFQIQPSIFENM